MNTAGRTDVLGDRVDSFLIDTIWQQTFQTCGLSIPQDRGSWQLHRNSRVFLIKTGSSPIVRNGICGSTRRWQGVCGIITTMEMCVFLSCDWRFWLLLLSSHSTVDGDMMCR